MNKIPRFARNRLRNLVIIKEIAAHPSGARNDSVTAFNAFVLTAKEIQMIKG
jgi:hypothetical protein